MITRDKAYALRLERHYAEIRAEVGQIEGQRDGRRLRNHDAQKGSFRTLTKGNGRPDNGF